MENMTLRDLVNGIGRAMTKGCCKLDQKILVECPDTGLSWTIEGLAISDDTIVLTLDKHNGTSTPETEFFFSED